jgi:hypothetical protein
MSTSLSQLRTRNTWNGVYSSTGNISQPNFSAYLDTLYRGHLASPVSLFPGVENIFLEQADQLERQSFTAVGGGRSLLVRAISQ